MRGHYLYAIMITVHLKEYAKYAHSQRWYHREEGIRMSLNNKLFKLILSALFLTAALLLPFVTGQIPKIGNMLCPMHFPVLLCGFFCGPWYGLAIGLIAPLLRFLIFGLPPIIPIGIVMCFELGTYGLIAGLLYQLLPSKKSSVYISLISAMLIGRVVWGIGRVIMYGLGKSEFGWAAFITGGFVTAVPGIILQLILIPILVITLEKYTDRN